MTTVTEIAASRQEGRGETGADTSDFPPSNQSEYADDTLALKFTNGPFVVSVPLVARPNGWPVLPDKALYGLAGEVVRIIEPHSEADPAALVIQFLVAAGNMIGRGPHCMVEATRHALNLYAVLAGETAKGRKGTSWGHVFRLCGQVDETWAAGRVTTGLSSAEGLIDQVRDNLQPLPDLQPDKRLLVAQGEFASVLKMMAREGNTLSPTMRDAWDSGNLRTLVKHDPLTATGAHISVIGHISRNELLRYLSDTEAHNGFANRFLWGCVARSKCLPEGGLVPEEQFATLATRLREVLNWADGKGDFELRRDGQARCLWADEYPRLSEGLPGLLGAATARAEAQVLRLSALYAVLDYSEVVQVEHLRAALAVWEYCFASAQFIFGEASGDPVADRIREALLDAGARGLTRTMIRNLLGKHETGDRIARALNQLAMHGVAKYEKRPSGGRDIELWFATEATKATEVWHTDPA